MPPLGPVTPPTPGPLPPLFYDASPTQPFLPAAEVAQLVLPGEQSNGSLVLVFHYPTPERPSVLAGLPELEDVFNDEQRVVVKQY